MSARRVSKSEIREGDKYYPRTRDETNQKRELIMRNGESHTYAGKEFFEEYLKKILFKKTCVKHKNRRDERKIRLIRTTKRGTGKVLK